MEQATPPESVTGLVLGDAAAMRTIEAQIRELFGRVAYSHKTHEKCADLALERLSNIKGLQILLSAITTGGILAVVLGPSDKSQLAAGVAAVVSTVLLALNAYTKENDLGQTAQQHKDAADRLWTIRESYLSLLADLNAGEVSSREARERREELQTTLASVYQSAPRTSSAGYKRAQKALKISEDLTFSDVEIDQFLPRSLRWTGK